MARIIFLNGPMGCGKTEAVRYLRKHYDIVDRRCKDKLFKLTQEFFCVTESFFWRVYNDRALKELPMREFAVTVEAYNQLCKITGEKIRVPDYKTQVSMVSLSVREAMIYVSEFICKPVFGQDYFGKARADSIKQGELAIDDSAGFDEELPPTLEKLGQKNCLLIRVMGRGSFEGDSRHYISPNIVKNSINVWNDATEAEFQEELHYIIEGFLNGKKYY